MLPSLRRSSPRTGDRLVGEEEGDDLDDALGVHEQAERHGIQQGNLKVHGRNHDTDQLTESPEEHDEQQPATMQLQHVGVQPGHGVVQREDQSGHHGVDLLPESGAERRAVGITRFSISATWNELVSITSLQNSTSTMMRKNT
jgi:hypothetical protein